MQGESGAVAQARADGWAGLDDVPGGWCEAWWSVDGSEQLEVAWHCDDYPRHYWRDEADQWHRSRRGPVDVAEEVDEIAEQLAESV